MEERRRHLRRTAEHEFVTIQSSSNVRILDISVVGLLMESRHPVDEGARGRLRLNLDGLPITVDIQVNRVVADAAESPRCRIAASFIALDVAHRELIGRFVTQ